MPTKCLPSSLPLPIQFIILPLLPAQCPQWPGHPVALILLTSLAWLPGGPAAVPMTPVLTARQP